MAKQDPEYYTIVFEKYLQLMTDTDRYYYMVATELKELASKNEIDNWENSAIPDFTETLVILHSLRTLLNKKINEPTREEVKFCEQNNIKDVLVTKQELVMLQKFALALDEQKALLQQEYGFRHEVN